MSSKGGFEKTIDPTQFSDHFVLILRAMGFIPHGVYARVKVVGIDGPIPIKVDFEKEVLPKGAGLIRTNEKRQKLQKGNGLRKQA